MRSRQNLILLVAICLIQCQSSDRLAMPPKNIPAGSERTDDGGWISTELLNNGMVRVIIWDQKGNKRNQRYKVRQTMLTVGVAYEWDEKGRLIQETPYVSGQIHGIEKIWRDSTISKIEYRHGQRQGYYEQSKTGEWIITGNFKDNEPYGPFILKRTDGRLEMGFFDEQMNPDGEWCYFNKDAILTQRIAYMNGKIIEKLDGEDVKKVRCIRDEYFRDYLAGHPKYKTYEEYEAILMQKSQPAKEKWLKERREQEKREADALLKKTGGWDFPAARSPRRTTAVCCRKAYIASQRQQTERLWRHGGFF